MSWRHADALPSGATKVARLASSTQEARTAFTADPQNNAATLHRESPLDQGANELALKTYASSGV